jgi:hypothetical protein
VRSNHVQNFPSLAVESCICTQDTNQTSKDWHTGYQSDIQGMAHRIPIRHPRIGTQDTNQTSKDWHKGYLECGNEYTVKMALHSGYHLRIPFGAQVAKMRTVFLKRKLIFFKAQELKRQSEKIKIRSSS